MGILKQDITMNPRVHQPMMSLITTKAEVMTANITKGDCSHTSFAIRAINISLNCFVQQSVLEST